MNKSNKVFCICSKCHHKDTERGIGLFIPKSTRTRHHVCTSSRSESSILVELFRSDNMISTSEGKASSNLSDKAENSSIDEGYIDEGSTMQDIDDNYEPSLGGTSSNVIDEFSDSNISHIKISEFREHIHLSDELACAIRLFRVKSHCNLTDNAFRQTMMIVNGSNVSLLQVR
ncbi:8223_t:CDS:2 [Funneliformis caledonium]|uniref:8223_t:CDS:1 n=1 Tax=Funneliformis caledonium TaxID=1117310 RepID=A0A9N9BH76_9GLOM|nr:8223_t:CDS:2 [Funneliformis caledonium]